MRDFGIFEISHYDYLTPLPLSTHQSISSLAYDHSWLLFIVSVSLNRLLKNDFLHLNYSDCNLNDILWINMPYGHSSAYQSQNEFENVFSSDEINRVLHTDRFSYRYILCSGTRALDRFDHLSSAAASIITRGYPG